MRQMKKTEYQKPQADVLEVGTCNLLCSSIVISNEEVNTKGRVDKRRDKDVWSEGLWN